MGFAVIGGVDAVKVRMQQRLASSDAKSSSGLIVEGHLILVSHPTPSEAAKPPKPIPFRV